MNTRLGRQEPRPGPVAQQVLARNPARRKVPECEEGSPESPEQYACCRSTRKHQKEKENQDKKREERGVTFFAGSLTSSEIRASASTYATFVNTGFHATLKALRKGPE